MKRFFRCFLILGMLAAFTACGNKQDGGSLAMSNADIRAVGSTDETVVPAQDGSRTESNQTENNQTENNQTESGEENDMTMNIQIGDNVLTAALVQNSSTEALIEMLSEGPVTIEMNDYASMEKVGQLPERLPRNDEQINTDAGDLILYQGNSFVIYYDTNSWSLTRLGKIDNVTKQELKDILGDGSVTAVLSLSTE